MVDQLRDVAQSRAINTILSGIGALGGVMACLLVIVNGLSTNTTNSHDIQALQGQVAAVSAQVTRLADKIDQGPRSDEMKRIDQHLSALDQRSDDMDKRVTGDEQTLTQVKTEVEGIRGASDAQLRGHVR